MLVAEAFDFSLLIGAEWLNDNFGVSILCCRIALAADAESGNEYLVCSNIYPTPELPQVAIFADEVAAANLSPGTTGMWQLPQSRISMLPRITESS